MHEQVKINGLDLWDNFKGNLIKGAYKELRGGFTAKDYVTNESRLETGKRVVMIDDSEQKFKSRGLTISFLVEGKSRTEVLDNSDNLVRCLSRGLIKFDVPRVGYQFNLIFREVSDITDYAKENFRILKIKFEEPDPSNRTRL